jgi:sugar lactone lactonase YvrE
MLSTALSGASILMGQITLNPTPSRVAGHPRLELSTGNPNLVEGRELYMPQGLAVDTSASPPVLYVSDTGNNRILVWKNAARFANGAAADLIIGQKDRYSTRAQGPGTGASIGLSSPSGLTVKDGDLYVVDTGNNRILRFPKPVAQQDQFPDMAIGQPNFNSRTANQGGAPTEKTLALASGNNIYRANLAFDSAGNLWVADPGNNRVLRYPSQAISQGTSGPAAEVPA